MRNFGKGGFESTLMNKKRSALGLALLLGVTVGLASCNRPTQVDTGSVLTYTDAAGNRVSYTAEQLLADYLDDGSSLSTEFDQVYEILVRNYYNDPSQASVLAELRERAEADVIADKQSATSSASSNGTTFEEEFEIILNSHDCDNADELFEYHLYQEERSRFLDDFYANFGTGNSAINGTEVMRDGSYTIDGTTHEAFPESEEWGNGDEGYLLEQMPYHVRHILVKLASASSGHYTTDTISESESGGEATNLASVIFRLAGVELGTVTPSAHRWTFGEIAGSELNGDTTSRGNLGELGTSDSTGIMTKVMASDLVNEFKLGIYAYESLYNQQNASAVDNAYGAANRYRLTPGLTEEAISTADIDADQVLENGKTVNAFFNETGIGQIPFGAALALWDNKDVDTDTNGNNVNDGEAAYFPRNIIFNKYFNKHNICVITPNAIELNGSSPLATDGSALKTAALSAINTVGTGDSSHYVTGENYKGVYCQTFGSLPGFSVDTTGILTGEDFEHNVLTNSEGEVILVVRAGTDSYQGVHFIAIKRSALSLYGRSQSGNAYVENATPTNGTATLSQYYTTYTTSSSSYPTYTDNDGNTQRLTTFVNYNHPQTSDQNTRSGNLISEIRGYNDNLTTFQFQSLVENNDIEFLDRDVEAQLQTYVRTARQSTMDDNFETWSDHWKSYAELIQAQEEERARGADTMTGTLISEHCAVGYGNPSKDDTWTNNGACYHDYR